MLLPVVVLAVLPLMGLFSPLIYAFDGRYGIIAFPFLALSVGIAIDELARRIPGVGAIAVPVVAVLVWVGGYLAPHLELVLDETDGNPNADTEEVVDLLQRSGIEFVSGSFWRVHPVEFVADDTIVGGVSPGHPVRFPEPPACRRSGRTGGCRVRVPDVRRGSRCAPGSGRGLRADADRRHRALHPDGSGLTGFSPMWHGRTLAVVLPTYNEAGSIAECIRGFESLGIVDDLVVVNNNAHPDTSPAVAGTSAREVHEAVQGYGAAIRRGLR